MARGNRTASIFRALRPHQWAKNLLLFVPALLAHNWSIAVWSNAMVAFIAMCACSSRAYVINDIVDLEADKLHAYKSKRPFAAGELSRVTGIVIAVLLLFCALALILRLEPLACVLLLTYIVTTVAYSLWLKTLMAVDLLVLASLYCLRVLLGGAATSIAISPWTVTFSMFLFFSLALMKRYAELYNLRAKEETRSPRRGYSVEDMPAISSLGSASAMTAVMVIALYVNGLDVRGLYTRPNLLFMMCVVVLLWLTRLWLLTHRGQMHEDPVLYAIRDRWSLILGGLAIAVILAAL
ncbi:MAG: UbiA family prenyltransferase [Bryobacteraceae bacterium]